MTTAWYQPFMVTVALVWLFSTERDRPAARIVLIATVASFLMVELFTRHITGAWKLVFPGAMETLTILALLRWADNRTGLIQVACLAMAWLAHPLCYADVKLHTDMVYSHYRAILGLVAFAQILGFHDTIETSFNRLTAWLGSLGFDRPDAVRAAGVYAFDLRDEGRTPVQTQSQARTSRPALNHQT